MNDQFGNNPEDKLLVDRVLGGEPNAFGTIIQNTQGLVASIVYKMISNPEDRKDIAQDIYLKSYKKLDSFHFRCRLSTWIAQIAYNTCLSWIEKKKLVLPGDLHENLAAPETEARLSQKDLSAIIKQGIESLQPPVYQVLITLYHQEEMSYEEIGEITNLPEGTVKSYLFRARKKLKENILSKYKKEAL